MIRTKRWNDPKERADGTRILVCRYRPRGLPKSEETWDEWIPDLGPSRELHADIYGKHGAPIAWNVFVKRYLAEMKERHALVDALRERFTRGEPITLLCSSACLDPKHCHRTLLKELVSASPRTGSEGPPRRTPKRRTASRGSSHRRRT